MPTKVVIFEEPDKILRSIGPFQQINFVKVPNVSRSKEVAGYTYTLHTAIYGTYHIVLLRLPFTGIRDACLNLSHTS